VREVVDRVYVYFKLIHARGAACNLRPGFREAGRVQKRKKARLLSDFVIDIG